MVAAATTSLPETPGGERNWDYRYSWIRDSTFMLWGLYTLGFDWEANDFFYFIHDVASGDEELQIMYGIGGERELTEETRSTTSTATSTRSRCAIGNGAYAPAAARRLGRAARLDLPAHEVARRAARVDVADPRASQVEQRDRPLARARPRHLGGPRRAQALHLLEGHVLGRLRPRRAPGAPARGHERAERWQAAADEIHADVCEHGVDERGVFCQHYDTDALDASLPAACRCVRFLPPDDERIVATVNAIADELTVDGLVLRYKVDETDDGLSGEEGTFAICSFWLVSALAEIGEHDRARALCERLLGYASPLDLYAEEIDARSGRHLGNFPQAFTHLALINAVMHVIRADHELVVAQPLLDATPRGKRSAMRAHRHPLRRRRGGRRSASPRSWPRRSTARATVARRGARALSGGSTLAARLRAARPAAARLVAACTSGSATSAAWRPTTRSPTHRLAHRARSTRRARRGTACRRARPARRARRRPTPTSSATSCSTSRSTAWGPTATPRRCSPASPQVDAGGRCLGRARLAQAAARARSR